ncbi:MAG: hypothetical protein JNK16_11275 [Phycisphaerales bacterium]|nr:hypothetical protein [Phycisphaerales bacterium]
MLGKSESTAGGSLRSGLRTTNGKANLGKAAESFMIDWKKTWVPVLLFVAMLGFGRDSARADVVFRDDFADLSKWTLQASDGVVAEIEPGSRDGTKSLKLKYDFRAGSGFVVVRRKIGAKLPENYRLSFRVMGSGPANNFETKLLDPSGDNVWWVNQRDYVPSAQGTMERFKRRHFSFAWGPSGGKPIEELGAIEFAIAASNGGSGDMEFSDLTLESVPRPSSAPEDPKILSFDGTADHADEAAMVSRLAKVIWWTEPGKDGGSFTVSLGGVREFGGIVARFNTGREERMAKTVELLGSMDGKTFTSLATQQIPSSGLVYVPLRDAEAAFLRLTVAGAGRHGSVLDSLEVAPLSFGESRNSTFARIAKDADRGHFPRYFGPEQTYWTVVGVADDGKEGLLNTDGALEVDKERFSIEPFAVETLKGTDFYSTWADAKSTQSLVDGYLPIPKVSRNQLDVEAFAFGPPGKSVLAARYTLHAGGEIVLAIRPLQVNPPWQDLKTSGGVARIDRIETSGAQAIVSRLNPADRKVLRVIGDDVESTAWKFDESTSFFGPRRGARTVIDEYGLAAGLFRSSDQARTNHEMQWAVLVPLHEASEMPTWASLPTTEALAALEKERQAVIGWWRTELNRVTLSIPADRALENTYRTAQAHILINRDGPAIQPGSRTYERSWIRDGCLTSSALLATGHAERVREFIDWYAPYQYPSGKVPCVVDKRGPDPVPEHDSHGQLLYLLHKYYIFTHDTATLEKNYPHVLKAVEYIESIRATRMTPEYANATGIKRAEFGLVPESISHEGYSAKPMHSYWDDFFVEKGLQDAADIARILGKAQDAERFGRLATDFRASVLDSVNRTMAHHKIDYIPGCVELGDFDATSTTIALWPCGGQAWLPDAALRRTFEKFYEFGMGRIDGTKKYNEYTPYEWRIVGAMIRLGWPEKAWKLADFYMADRRPAAWNQWAEVVWRDPKTPKFIGDMPHTWVASDFLNSVRSMFVYEDEASQALVLGAGIKPEWLAGEGVSIGSWPTEFGVLSYAAKRDGRRVTLNYEFSGALPAGKLILSPNLAGRQMVLSEPKGIVEIELP